MSMIIYTSKYGTSLNPNKNKIEGIGMFELKELFLVEI